MPAVRCAVGIDVGGTKIAAGLVTDSGEMVFSSRGPTPASQGPVATSEAVVAIARATVEEARARGFHPTGIGIGTGGQVDTRNQRIIGSTALLPGWAGTPLGQQLQEAVGLHVFLDNDAKVVARAELLWGSARGCGDAVFVTLGTGVGGAVAVGGQVVDGACGFAGHIGHVTVRPKGDPCSCGRLGCLEAYASASGIRRLATRYGGGKATVDDATDVFRLAADGVDWAERAVEESAAALGQAMADLVHVLNPEVVVIGGGLSAWGEPWLARVEPVFRAYLMDVFRSSVSLRLATFGPQAGVMGAAALAMERLSRVPRPACGAKGSRGSRPGVGAEP